MRYLATANLHMSTRPLRLGLILLVVRHICSLGVGIDDTDMMVPAFEVWSSMNRTRPSLDHTVYIWQSPGDALEGADEASEAMEGTDLAHQSEHGSHAWKPVLEWDSTDLVRFLRYLAMRTHAEEFARAVRDAITQGTTGPSLVENLADLHLSGAAEQELLVELGARAQRFPLSNSAWHNSADQGDNYHDFATVVHPSGGQFFLETDHVNVTMECASRFCSLHGLLAIRVDRQEVQWSADARRVIYISRLHRGRHVVDMQWCFRPCAMTRVRWDQPCQGITVLRHSVSRAPTSGTTGGHCFCWKRW